MKPALAVSLLLLLSTPALASTKLIDAVKRGDAKSVRALLAQRAAVNAADADGSTALHWAVERDNLEISGLLLAAGANVNAATRYKITPVAP